MTEKLQNFENYEQQLLALNSKINEYFESQKEYIFCKAGCGICCQNSYYPCSELEYGYLKTLIATLDEKTKEEINQKALNILSQRKEFMKTNTDIMQFSYECPFLVNDACSVYSHRPLMCRGYGLLYHEYNEPEKLFVPYCTNLGLNYSNVYDPVAKKIDQDKVANCKTPPTVFNTTYSSLMDAFEGMDFGDVRMLYEFLILDMPDCEKILKKYE